MYTRVVQLSLPRVQTIDIEFRDVRYKARMGFRGPYLEILKGIDGSFRSGQLTAIMGPSGAGKSTLLNLLTGFERKNWEGTVEYVSNDSKQDWSQYRKQACYIQQDDQLQPLFTTEEIMLLAADLKIGNSLNRKAKEMLVDDILESLDLAKTKETQCGHLSGGQKKRLSIALELIDNPPVMFLDEPTTGLDSLSSSQCIGMLQCLARSGRTIVCTIHQPSATIFEMFDRIYLVAEGQCMYEGSPRNIVSYFASQGFHCPVYHNPADYILEVVNKEFGNFNQQLAKAALATGKASRSPDQKVTGLHQPVAGAQATDKDKDKDKDKLPKPGEPRPTNNPKGKHETIIHDGKIVVLINPPPEYLRFWILLNRSMIQLYRDRTRTHLRLLIHGLIGFCLGMFYTDIGSNGKRTINNVGFFLVTVTYLCYTAMLPAVFKLPSELAVLRKERFNNWYQLRTYYASLLFSNMPLPVAFAFLYTCLSYFLSSQPPELSRFLMFAAIAALTALIADSFGLLIATLVNPTNGTFIGAIIVAVMLLFSGFLALFNHMPHIMNYISYLSYLKYSLHGLMHAVYGFNREKLSCPEDTKYCHYRFPQLLMDEFAMNDGSYWTDVVILLSCFLLLRVIAYCTLKRKLTSL